MISPEIAPVLADRQSAWQAKPVLRTIYADLFSRMEKMCVPGKSLEVGGGTGLGKYFLPNALSSDIQFCPWLDLVADCHDLPFQDDSLQNIFMLDVFHHLEAPTLFLKEAQRVLGPGGRLIMVEPAMTLLSKPFYTWLHEEPVDMSIDPLAMERTAEGKDPFDGNQAIPTLMFSRNCAQTMAQLHRLRLIKNQTISLWGYPLSGGYKPWSLLPAALATTVLRLEAILEPILGRWIGFRMITVLEKAK